MQSMLRQRHRLFPLVVLVILMAGASGIIAPTRAQVDPGVPVVYFPQTGHYLRGQFLSFWQQNGGVPIFGYPITEEYQRNNDKKIVQHFERARFELNQEGGQGVVELGNLGAELLTLQRANYPPVALVPNTDTLIYFPDTGHTLQGGFKSFWEAHNGPALFGSPISEEFLEISSDGIARTVQYFEKVRFEFDGTTVQIGMLGELFAPCHLTPGLPPNEPPTGPLVEGEPDEDAPECIKPNLIATGYVYPSPNKPGTVLGFDARGFLPAEVVSMWLNVPGGTVRKLPYTAMADANGDVLVGFETLPDDPAGRWELVAQGVSSRRMAVAPFLLQP